MGEAEEASFTPAISLNSSASLAAESIPQKQDKPYEPIESSERMMQPGQVITSLLFAGVLPAIFASHRLHRLSAGMIPLDFKSPCTSLGLPLKKYYIRVNFVDRLRYCVIDYESIPRSQSVQKCLPRFTQERRTLFRLCFFLLEE